MREESPGTIRPGGRTALTRARVLEAVRALLVRQGVVGLTMDALARESGVNRTTIYRRWGNLTGVVAELASEIEAGLEVDGTDTLAGDLRTSADMLAELLSGDGARLVQALLGWRNPAIRTLLDGFWRRRREALAATLDEHGVRADPGTVLALAAGPIYYSVLSEGAAPSASVVDAAVRAALAECERAGSVGTNDNDRLDGS